MFLIPMDESQVSYATLFFRNLNENFFDEAVAVEAAGFFPSIPNLCNAQVIVKEGIKSIPGRISSTKLNTPPKAPFHPPKVRKKIKPEIGAQARSANSPRKGIEYVA